MGTAAKIPLQGREALTLREAMELVAYLDSLIEQWPGGKMNAKQRSVIRARNKVAEALFYHAPTI